ncbi:MAG: hypothetical protein HZC54_06630 [Verrucomicrobia bacterium]|nr:hypothetical protein [Verrucomicrobiota bacterium]
MNRRTIGLLLGLAALLQPLNALAQSSEPAGGVNPWATLIGALVPLIFFAGIIYFFLRQIYKKPIYAQTKEYYCRSIQHMERMEALAERLVTALEKQNKG